MALDAPFYYHPFYKINTMKFLNIYLEVLKNFGDFKTRSNKTEFWVFVLINIVVSFVIGLLNSYTLNSLYSLAILVPGLAVGTRRLHDIGKSGWTQLWMFLPIIGWIYLILLFIKEGETQANQWGEVPEKIEL